MRKIIAGFASSIDGYIAGPNGEYDWILIDPEIDFAAEAKKYDTYLYGRKSYEDILAMKMPIDKASAHFVFSTSLKQVADGFTLVSEDAKTKLLSLKAQQGKDIAVFGGAGLLSSLLNLQLVDEIHVSIIPVLLGAGKPMVNNAIRKLPLSLHSTKTFSNGTVQLIYHISSEP